MSRPTRHELKFVVHHTVRELLLQRWGPHLVRDPLTSSAGAAPVLSQYYDTPSFAFCEDKLDGVGVRTKVRLRVYANQFTPGAPAFLEIKQRLDDRVRKIRSRLRSFRWQHLNPAHWEFEDEGLGRVFRGLAELHRLRRSAQVWYMREAYQSAAEPDVRITLDSGLTGLFAGEVLGPRVREEGSRRLMPDTLSILEIKSTGPIPSWALEGVEIGELEAQPIPKYVLAVDGLGLRQAIPTGDYA